MALWNIAWLSYHFFDDPQELRRHVPTWVRDEQAAEVFLHSGFTPGTRTLAHEVYAAPAGSVVELRPDGTWSSRPWEAYHYDPEPVTSPQEFSDVLRTALDVVVEITADAEAVVARLLKRAGEQGRADDTEPVIRRRLEVYAESTAPLADLYAERDLLVQVDGMGEIDVVTGRIMEALASRGITGS